MLFKEAPKARDTNCHTRHYTHNVSSVTQYTTHPFGRFSKLDGTPRRIKTRFVREGRKSGGAGMLEGVGMNHLASFEFVRPRRRGVLELLDISPGRGAGGGG